MLYLFFPHVFSLDMKINWQPYERQIDLKCTLYARSDHEDFSLVRKERKENQKKRKTRKNAKGLMRSRQKPYLLCMLGFNLPPRTHIQLHISVVLFGLVYSAVSRNPVSCAMQDPRF